MRGRRNWRPIILSAIAALLLCVSFAMVAAALENMEGIPESLNGTVTSVDTSKPLETLTIQPTEPGPESLNSEVSVIVNDQTVVKVCDAKKSLKDIKPGSDVQVTYFDVAGLAIADFIYKSC